MFSNVLFQSTLLNPEVCYFMSQKIADDKKLSFFSNLCYPIIRAFSKPAKLAILYFVFILMYAYGSQEKDIESCTNFGVSWDE